MFPHGWFFQKHYILHINIDQFIFAPTFAPAFAPTFAPTFVPTFYSYFCIYFCSTRPFFLHLFLHLSLHLFLHLFLHLTFASDFSPTFAPTFAPDFAPDFARHVAQMFARVLAPCCCSIVRWHPCHSIKYSLLACIFYLLLDAHICTTTLVQLLCSVAAEVFAHLRASVCKHGLSLALPVFPSGGGPGKCINQVLRITRNWIT